MRKIVVIGSGGSGKSVLARTLGAITQIPVYHLDAMYWKPGWEPTPSIEWEARQRELVQRDAWIIDGMYNRTLPIRLRACDTILFLDFPRGLTTYRVIKRGLQYYGKTRPDLSEGCPEKLRWDFLKLVWTFREHKRPGLIQAIKTFPDKTLIRLTRPREVQNLIERVRNGWEPQVGVERLD